MKRTGLGLARAAGVALSLAFGLSSSSARADAPDPQKRAMAQALFDEAKRLTEQHKDSEACPKLLESYRLDPAMGTKFYLARCYEAIGKFASAWSYYLEVVDEAHKEGAADKEKFANDRAAALKQRLPRLTVSVSAETRRMGGLVVKRDGIPVGEGTWDTPLPVDLGDHVITATAPGRKSWEGHVDAKEEGGTVRVDIPALEPVSLPTPEPAIRPIADVPAIPPAGARWTSKQAIAGWAVGGVGVVGLLMGAGFGADAMSKQKQSNSGGCTTSPDACNAAGRALRVDAINAATVSTAMFVAGGVLTAAGIVILVTTPPPKAAPSAVGVGLRIDASGGSVVGRF